MVDNLTYLTLKRHSNIKSKNIEDVIRIYSHIKLNSLIKKKLFFNHIGKNYSIREINFLKLRPGILA